MSDNQEQDNITKAGLFYIAPITFILVMAVFFIFSKLNAFSSRELFISVFIGIVLGLIILSLIIFVGVKIGTKIRPAFLEMSSNNNVKRRFSFINSVALIIGLWYFVRVGIRAFYILNKAIGQKDNFAITAGIIGLMVASLIIIALVL